jgi:hypothetical protein
MGQKLSVARHDPDDPRHINVAKRIARSAMPISQINMIPGKRIAHYQTTGQARHRWTDYSSQRPWNWGPFPEQQIFKEKTTIQVIGADPEGHSSPLFLSYGRKSASYKVGVWEKTLPGALDMSVIDQMLVVQDKEL